MVTLKKGQLTYRFCDALDEVFAIHGQLRTICRDVQRLLQPLLLLILLYHWCNFVVQAYLLYISIRYSDRDEVLIVLFHYSTVLLGDLMSVCFICSIANLVVKEAAEAGLVVQRFNEFRLDTRLERTVQCYAAQIMSSKFWFRFQLELFSMELLQDKLQLTLYGLFNVDNLVIQSVSGELYYYVSNQKGSSRKFY